MARQRMYVFERAYTDYAARLRGFVRKVGSSAGATWRWFWSGPGSRAFEIIISLLLIAAATYVTVLYVRYETGLGHRFSAGMLGTILLIFGITLAVLFGWKAALHFLARVTSGATASAVILVLMTLALVALLLIFSNYLVVLVVLTGLSFLIFIPINLALLISRLIHKITYRCPYDDCTGRGQQPVHVCSCGHEYTDLEPSFYGIFHHTCRHPNGDVKLPTLDLLGRNRLPRKCGKCKRPLIHSSFGFVSEKPIAIVGGPAVGKTIFLRQAVRLLRQRLNSVRGAVARIDSEEQEKQLAQDLSLLDRGQVVAKTAEKTVAFGLEVRIPRRLRALLLMFDAPGEQYLTMSRFAEKQVVQHLQGIVLLIDPQALTALGEARDTGNALFKETVSVLLSGVNSMLVKRPTDLCDVPLAVVIAKADLLPVDEYPFLKNLVTTPANPHNEALNTRVRQALEKLGEGGSLRALEQKFKTVQYFACSALGRSPDLRNAAAFQPSGVIDPLLWLLNLEDLQPAREKQTGLVMSGAPAGD